MSSTTTSARFERASSTPEHPTRKPPPVGKPNPWHVNVHPVERAASALIGGALVGLGASKPTGLRLLGVAAGMGLLFRGITGHCGGYALMNTSTNRSKSSTPPSDYFEHAIHLETAVTIDKPATELFNYWNTLANLPRIMEGLESVTDLGNGRSHWVVKAPLGTVVQWEAEIIAEETSRLISWRSMGNADVENAGSVRFVDAPEGRGTEVRVVIDYLPPAGRVGAVAAKLFGYGPKATITADLRRFKAVMEAGEAPTIEGQSRGTSC